MPAGDQIDCYLSRNVRINKGELKKRKKKNYPLYCYRANASDIYTNANVSTYIPYGFLINIMRYILGSGS